MKKNSKKKSAIFEPELKKCPLCANSGISQKYLITKYNPEFKIDECDRCGFIFMNPRFSKAYITDLYSGDYYSGAAEYSYYDERQAEKNSAYVWEKRIAKIREFVSEGTFLDVGCSFGGFLQTASEFFRVFGIDVSEYAGGYAKERFEGSVHVGTLHDHPFRKNYFDVITMIEFLEHESDPLFAVKECFRLLKKDGLLVVQTANMAAMQAKYLKDKYAMFMPGHLSYFTKRNLVHLLRWAGFSSVKIFYPVEFGLLPKLLKSKADFKSLKDYLRWVRITKYHLLSKIHLGDFAATSSMVIYALK